MLLIENMTLEDIEIKDMGITIPANGTYDLHTKNRDILIRSNGVLNKLIDGSCKLIKDQLMDQTSYYDTAHAIRIITDASAAIKTNESGELEVNMGSKQSEVGDKKLWVHESPKPEFEGKQFFAYYTSRGDDIENRHIGKGENLEFVMEPGTNSMTKRIEFIDDPAFGRTYIHEAYAQWNDAKLGDHFCVCVYSKATQLQTVLNKDLVLESFTSGNKIVMAPGGPGTGTHGFAATPILVKSHLFTGAWDYSSEGGLVPNMERTGGFDIYDVDMKSNEFMNRIPLLGTSSNFARLESKDTAWIPPGYYIEVEAHNVSNSSWQLTMLMTMFRERTTDPVIMD